MPLAALELKHHWSAAPSAELAARAPTPTTACLASDSTAAALLSRERGNRGQEAWSSWPEAGRQSI